MGDFRDKLKHKITKIKKDLDDDEIACEIKLELGRELYLTQESLHRANQSINNGKFYEDKDERVD